MSDLLTVVVSYNRLELLQRTLESYRRTVTLPNHLLIVDNNSDAETRTWLKKEREPVIFLTENRYPGFATNLGWQTGLKTVDAKYLHRSDNDFEYQPGWCDEIVGRFEDPALGQLGLRTLEEEGPHGAVGGCSVIRREVWDAGVRYSEAGWPAAPFEDAGMSAAVRAVGYQWARAQRPCATHIGIASADDPYYQETFGVRGLKFASWGVT